MNEKSRREEIENLLDELILLQGDSYEGYRSTVDALVDNGGTVEDLELLDQIAEKKGIDLEAF